MHGDDVEERFWDKVRIGDGCWEWTSARTKTGYGQFRLNGRTRQAQQVAWELWHGLPFPAGMEACHTCDHPWCMRPSHVFIGTHVENIADMDRKGRRGVAVGDSNGSRRHPGRLARGDLNPMRLYPDKRPCGESHGGSKLSEADVVEMRRLHGAGESSASIGRRFGIGRSQALAIIKRHFWKHVP